MTELAIHPSGTYSDHFIVSFAGEPYAIPEKGADLALRLRGRVPSSAPSTSGS